MSRWPSTVPPRQDGLRICTPIAVDVAHANVMLHLDAPALQVLEIVDMPYDMPIRECHLWLGGLPGLQICGSLVLY